MSLDVGTIVRRHRVQRPGGPDGQFYTVEDLNIGHDLTVYSRQFRLVDCDPFTKNFLTKLGVRLNPPQPIPGDPHGEQRRMVRSCRSRVVHTTSIRPRSH